MNPQWYFQPGIIDENPDELKNSNKFRLKNGGSNGVSDYVDPEFQPEQDEEYDAELYYGIYFADWLTIRPNLQYVWDPGGVEEVDDAFVFGVKAQVEF